MNVFILENTVKNECTYSVEQHPNMICSRTAASSMHVWLFSCSGLGAFASRHAPFTPSPSGMQNWNPFNNKMTSSQSPYT